MGTLGNWRVSTRMQLLVGLTLLGLIILCLTALFQLKNSMLEDRKQTTRNLVEVGIGIVAHHHKLAAAGKMSEEDAKKAARDSLRGLRYGKDDYFFGFDTTGVYFLHGGNPAVEGQQKIEMKDTNGKLLIKELISAAQAGGGFVDYWFPRAGQQVAEPKLGYAALFGPWNWVVGTGIYIDDVDREYRESALLLGGISLALLVILSLVGWQVGSSVLRQLGGEPATAAGIMQRVADGDLTASVNSAPAGSMLHALSAMVGSLRQLVSEINSDANRLVSSAESIAKASDEVARSAEQQSDATSAMAAAIEELTVSSSHISESARETALDSTQAVELSSQGTERVNQATQAIEQIAGTVSDASGRIKALEERARQVSSIANVIKDIAGQTNLLALNAAIEAARAGEQGRGFAVVADEVRKLAERTSLATTEIEQMIVGIQSDTVGAVEAMDTALPEVQAGVELAGSASESLRAIEEGARRTLTRIGDVADATREQSSASTSIAQRVEQIANMVEATTDTIRGTAATAHQLESIAINLKQLIGRFRV
ncbi:methyl-accepting chemotaxis protein [Ferribacterium limneticum]|uniref:methyl-accepting chemotaxis protein n=1 Tax=Ferribacterium limneticum TaxID=76259 RepID=UPI001CFA6197|nr:methyl-accepting chemotaxis protein [Ferribacterium limneticum]UCV20401.1 methyl-accepting chemotaxis protein [Ferribacterium limneticum]